MEKLKLPKHFDLKNPAFYYKDKKRFESLIFGLMTFAIQVYEGCYKVKNIAELRKVVAKLDKGIAKTDDLEHFLKEHLVDQIRTTILFENLIKSALLNHKMVIHLIDKNIHPALHKKQKEEPIHVSEIITKENYYVNEEKTEYFFRGLTNRTVTMNTVLNQPKYKKLIDYPQDILEVIRKVNDDRNDLHLYIKGDMEFGTELQQYELIKSVLDKLKMNMKIHRTEEAQTETKVVLIEN